MPERKQLQEELGQKGGLGEVLSDDELLKKIDTYGVEGRRGRTPRELCVLLFFHCVTNWTTRTNSCSATRTSRM